MKGAASPSGKPGQEAVCPVTVLAKISAFCALHDVLERLLDSDTETAPSGAARHELEALLSAVLLAAGTQRSSPPRIVALSRQLPQATNPPDADAPQGTVQEYASAVGAVPEFSIEIASRGRRVEGAAVLCRPVLTLAQDLRWSELLRRWEGSHARLANANAVLNTLGGGYFLCRQADQAIRTAKTHEALALQMGDSFLLGRCRINEAYSYIWLGRYRRAFAIISAEQAAAVGRGDSELEALAATALLFLRRARSATRALKLRAATPLNCGEAAGSGGGGGGNGGDGSDGGGVSATHDDFFRVRPVLLPRARLGAPPLPRAEGSTETGAR